MVARGRVRRPAARRLPLRRMRVPLGVIVASGVVLGAAVPAVAVPTAAGAGYAPCSVITWRSGVSFGIVAELARDAGSGFGRKAVRRGGGSFDVGVGRGWMVVHEVLHSLGLGHSDEKGSVMSPVARITNVLGRAAARREQRALPRPGYSSGDLATLEAMYPRAGCPAGSS